MSVVVITGAAGGLGAAVARQFAAAGASLCLLDRDRAPLESLARDLGATPLLTDVADESSVGAAAVAVERQHGRCDVLVNNAALYRRAPLEAHPTELWDEIIGINLRGYFLCTRAFGRLMLAGEGGAIVNVTSIAAHVPTPGAAAYCASKAAILALTRQTAVEWGPKGVRANAVSPGFMRTAMSVVDYAQSDLARAREERVPIRRIADPEDVARTIVFLAGPDAGYVSGEELTVDGGLTKTLSETFPRPVG
jgi:NAD(P)-dependent dehydrogenase (short-subunit alcohol dehydrogenase family)